MLKTPADGAQAERQAFLRYLRRRRKDARLVDALDILEIEQWVQARAKRCQAREGGLGRKKAAK